MKTKGFRLLAVLLVVLTVVGMFPFSAFAADEGERAIMTDRYINEADGRDIAAAQTVKSSEAKNPQTITGYEYKSYSEGTDHIYAKEDLTYILGYPDKTVRGERYLCRSEAAAIFYRLYDGYYPTVQRQMKSTTFSDVPRDAWYYKELETCYNVGVISGFGDGTFRPNDPVTRAEFAVMAARFAELTNSDKTTFKDVTRDHWAYLEINAAAAAGWIKGYPDGAYRPETNITRAETVTFINRVRNRSVTAAELKNLGVVNPYTDLVEGYWAYTDLMEATVKHAASDWHHLTYNNGKLNIIVEKYVDESGKEIAEPTVTQGKVNYAARQFDRHYYLGYITTVTYVYSVGAAHMTATKSVDKTTAKVGDTLTYTLTVGNTATATANLEKVVIVDTIPEDLSFVHGSVQVGGVTAQYSYDNAAKKLSVQLGDIAPGQSKTITFTAVVNDTAYGKKFSNTAAFSADNDEDKTASDGGVTVDDGETGVTAVKSVDKSTAKVGDTLTYTLTIANAKTATADIEKAVVVDTLPEYVSFTHGSVQVDGKTTQYSYDSKTHVLAVELGSITAGATKTVTFAVVVNANAYGRTFNNTAVFSADNSDDLPVIDGGVTVGDGKAYMTASKSADKSNVKVGDTLTYTIVVGNDRDATVNLKNVVMRDVICEYLNFSYGSVQIDGVSAKYTYDSATGLLSVELGDIAPGKSKTVTFAATVRANAYNKSFRNVAVLSADNDSDKTVSDSGVSVADGKASMSATKSVSRSTVKVGDTLTYTITATNDGNATVNLRDVVMSDVISEYLSFTHGSVQVDGYSARYSYDNASRRLSVELGDIAPGQMKTVTFTAVINSAAYGKSFTNTAVLSADNDGDKTVTDGGVTVADGTAEGSVGSKTVSKSTAKVGDSLTYTITLRNSSTATGAWQNVMVADVIPEYLSFVSGSVEEDGRVSANASYNAGTKTLTLFADSIAPGTTKTFTFKVTVQDGAQGKYIVNTAIISSDGREDIQLPDTGVSIDAGETAPSMTKAASVSTAYAGDFFTYTVTAKNGMGATVAWKNVVLSDVLPTGVKLVSGSVTLNGQTVSYGVAGQAIEVTVGDLKPGQDATLTFDVRVLDSAEGTTINNVAIAKGDNGQKTATDNGVTIPKPEDETDGAANTVTGTKTVDKTIVSAGDKVTYTVTAVNNSTETWAGVQVYDVLDTSALTLIDDSIYINGIRYLSGSGKWTFIDKQLVVNLGDIAPGQTVKVDFQVKFKNDAAGSTYTNHATIKSTNKDSVYVKAPEVIIMSGGNGGKEPLSYSEIHYKLFVGYGDGAGNPLYVWRPDDNITLNQMCLLGYRMMTDYYRSSLGNGTITVPDGITTSREVQYFISHGVISAAEYSVGTDATQSQIYRILNFAIGAGLASNSGAEMSRANVASLICDLTGRDKSPNTNGLPVAYFSDKGSYKGLIDEVSNSHDYTINSSGKETWISILSD